MWLPPSFWASHPVLDEIRVAAAAKVVSPDLLLYAILARIGAIAPHGCRIEAGAGKPVGLGLFVMQVGVSGGGKSVNMWHSRELVPVPPADEVFIADGVQPASGEAIPEALFTSTTLTAPARGGRPRRVMEQTKFGAILEFPEAQKFFMQSERQGTTLEATIRQSLNPIFDNLLVSAARSWKYRPAMKDGVYVRFTKTLTLLP